MVETKSITLPDSVWNGLAALAAKRNVPLDSVVQDAIERYERAEMWQDVLAYGEERFQASGYSDEDVVRLCRETRAEMALETRSERNDSHSA